jgi:hypothetical protein
MACALFLIFLLACLVVALPILKDAFYEPKSGPMCGGCMRQSCAVSGRCAQKN